MIYHLLNNKYSLTLAMTSKHHSGNSSSVVDFSSSTAARDWQVSTATTFSSSDWSGREYVGAREVEGVESGGSKTSLDSVVVVAEWSS